LFLLWFAASQLIHTTPIDSSVSDDINTSIDDENKLNDHEDISLQRRLPVEGVLIGRRAFPGEGILLGKRGYPTEGILLGKRGYPTEGILLGKRGYPTEGILLGKRNFRFFVPKNMMTNGMEN
jgi:hypothetical protein